jgi:quercetin dioxygenase-like cupin family protein
MDETFAVIDLEAVEPEPFPESGTAHRKLTERLGCSELRVNAITLQPGQATAPHTHERQEEVYVALDGGTVRIDGTDHAVAPGGVVRVGPDAVRSIRNETETSQTWLAFGAPPLGTTGDFGEYRMPES